MIKPIYSLIILIQFLVFINVANAQSGIVHVGGDVSGSDGSVSFTIGQVDYITVTGPDGSINPGIQQVYDGVGVSVPSTITCVEFINVYPNPTSGIFTLEIINEKLNSELSIEIYSIYGDLIKKAKLRSDGLQTLDISDKPAGLYHLRAIIEKKLTVIKIIKQ